MTPKHEQESPRDTGYAGERLLSRKEVSRWLGVTAQMVARLSIPVIRIGRRRLYTPTDVREWLNQRKEGDV